MLGLRINGQTVYRPGGYSKYSVAVIGGVNPASVGLVQLIGEADEGPSGYQEFGSPAAALAALGSGPLARDALVAFQPFDDADIPGGAFRLQCYKTNAGTQSATTLPMATAAGNSYVTAAGSTTTSLVYPALSFVADAEVGRWVLVGSEKRRIIANSTTTLTLPTTTPLSVAPPITTTTTILQTSVHFASKGYGLSSNRIGLEFEASATPRKYVLTVTKDDVVEPSPLLCGDPVLRVMYVGGTVPALTTSGTATGPVVTATPTVISVTLANTPGASALAGMVIQLPGGLQRLIASHTNVASPCVITLDPLHALTASQAAACVGGTATVRNSMTASVTVNNNAFLAATTLVGDSNTLMYATLGISTLRQLVNYLNANTNFLAVVADGVNADTTLLADMDWGQYQYSNNGAVDCRFDFGVEDVELATDSPAFYSLPVSVWSPQPLRRSRFFQDVAALVAHVNDSSHLVTATRGSISGTSTHEGAYLPAVTGGVYGVQRDVVVYLVGGTRGTSSNANWQTGFDVLKTKRSNSIVPCLSQDLTNEGFGSTATFDSVMAMLKTHMITRNANGRNEAAAYVGMNGTKAQLMALGRSFSSQNVHVVGQRLTYPDVDARLVSMDAHAFAAACAGGRAGSKEVGTPLMWKTLRASSVTQDPSWSPSDDDDFNDLTLAGVMMCADSAETAEQTGIYVLYDRTSYTQDAANDLFNDGNMAEELRFFIYDFRTRWAKELGGNKVDNTGGAGAASPTVTSAYSVAVPILDSYKKPPFNIMFNTEYPAGSGKFIPGWDQLSVRVAGNATYGSVRVAFAPGTVYVVPEIQAIATVNASA